MANELSTSPFTGVTNTPVKPKFGDQIRANAADASKLPTLAGTADASSKSAESLNKTGATFLNSATAALDPYIDRLKKLLAGDRTETLSAAAPDVARVSSQYDTAFKAAQTNLSRGGGRNAVSAEIPFQKAGAVEGILQDERTEAGKELGGVGSQLAQIGLSASEGGSQAFASLLQSLVGKDANDSALTGQALSGAGNALGGLAALAFL